jgi:hypothetical protein
VPHFFPECASSAGSSVPPVDPGITVLETPPGASPAWSAAPPICSAESRTYFMENPPSDLKVGTMIKVTSVPAPQRGNPELR